MDNRHHDPAAPTLARAPLRQSWVSDEARLVNDLAGATGLDAQVRRQIRDEAAHLVTRVRADASPTVMESFLAEYGLSTEEGIGLMCLAEALLRVPDPETIDALISDKIEPGNWGAHLGHSASSLVNAATWALMLSGKVLDDDPTWPTTALRGLIRRVGEPVVRTAVSRAIGLLGEQFVLGETIDGALANARAFEKLGYTYSYDMLGEAARTYSDARDYHAAYAAAIARIAGHGTGDIRTSPGISVKLSALNPRHEWCQRDRVLKELVPALLELSRQAAAAGIGLNIDAEEANRLELSLDVVERVLADPSLDGWDGFGFVVQAYGRRALPVIDHLHALAQTLHRRIMVRLVKGAYWDSEIKHAQTLGLAGFPVFTRKAHTDISYLACARTLFDRHDRLYAQFATHNAHTLAAVRAMAPHSVAFEFQRLHGMGEALHEIARHTYGTRCRIYAPVGAHRDLLAYLVRRLLENGANSSFVHQIVDASIKPEDIVADPIDLALAGPGAQPSDAIRQPADVFRPGRANARGFDVNEPASVAPLMAERDTWRSRTWTARALMSGGQTSPDAGGDPSPLPNPADGKDVVGHVIWAGPELAREAVGRALGGFRIWSAKRPDERAQLLRTAADLYETHASELMALACREAGKTLADAIAEIREAVDFLNFYAGEAERLEAERPAPGRGVFVCISPWNFPLAIFTGQIAGSLAAGNAAVAKAAEQTPLIAHRATELLHQAGVPHDALICIPGDGPGVGAPLTQDTRIAGVCFTGSLDVARMINCALRENAGPMAEFIAETGGLNAMIVDSTALPEQAVRDVLASAFQSAGQRCSALRMLYVQDDVHDHFLEMLCGAMETLVIGDPWLASTDIGPVIDGDAQRDIQDYCASAKADGRIVKALEAPGGGHFVGPTLIAVNGIADIPREIFGPVLHISRFDPQDLESVIGAINAKGYGLTFGLSTRIDDRVEHVVNEIRCGNIYVNRNQIGAVVGSQPFGGMGLSGTGPKAGGAHYVARLRSPAPQAWAACDTLVGREKQSVRQQEQQPRQAIVEAVRAVAHRQSLWARRADRVAELSRVLAGGGELMALAATFDGHARGVLDLPGPTGESNRLSYAPRGIIVCLGPSVGRALFQAALALAAGNGVLVAAEEGSDVYVSPGCHDMPLAVCGRSDMIAALASGLAVDGVMAAADDEKLRAFAITLAKRTGAIVPLIIGTPSPDRLLVEQHLCIDTTAAGGNASLLAGAG
ncbi:MAG: bifunctional proline dehydrogenase/L-glutamate gamma-semialdehyde dehydrogenase PutA [Hyphomicrobiaceae bacterium]